MSLRVLFLTHRLPYAPNRGDRIRAYHLLRLLAARHEVHLVSLTQDAEEASHVGDLRGAVASVESAPVPGRSRLLRAALALPGRKPLTHVLLHSPAIDGILRRRVRLVDPQVVLAYCTGMARYALQPPLATLPFVLDMVDVDSEKWSALGRSTAGPLGWIYRREAHRLRTFEQQVVARASATVISSERERATLAAAAPGCNGVMVPNGVDARFFAPPADPSPDPGVVFSGVFNYAPNEDGAAWFAREVWPIVRRGAPRARLTLVGMNPSRVVRSLASDSSIVVTGAVPDVRPYLWQSALSVAPLRFARGVQNKVLEAVAAGLPCVVTPEVYAGLPDAVRPACVLASGPAAFARAVLDALAAGGPARRAMAGRATLSALAWETQLAPFLDLVDKAASRT